MRENLSRREFLSAASALGISGLIPGIVQAQAAMPVRRIPGTEESLPIVGLGSSKVVSQISERGTDPLRGVLGELVAHGGSVVDTWPRNPDNDGPFGEVISGDEFSSRLFVTTKIDQVGKQAGIDQFEQTLDLYRSDSVDLAQIFSLTDLYTHWPSLKDWKDTGKARYIGVTVSQDGRHAELEEFLGREDPDFIQVNYSIVERKAEERLLPMAADRGIAVLINRPFMNGAYFQRLANVELPEWTREFDCETWAQFSLKYILAHPSITTVLTETSNPVHMAENAQTASSTLPDAAARARMTAFIDQV